MSTRRRILLWASDSYPHGRDMLRGAMQFARHREAWEVVRRPPHRLVPDRALLRKAHGTIAFINTERGLQAFAAMRGWW